MGRKKQNRSKQRKAAKAAEETNIVEFHHDDDFQGLLEHLHKEKKIDCIKLAKFLPNTATDVRDGSKRIRDVLWTILQKYAVTFGLIKQDEESMYKHLSSAVFGLQTEASVVNETCWECGKAECHEKLLLCTGCRVANYCSKDCQLKAWKRGHKKTCVTLQAKYKGFQESISLIEDVHGNSTNKYPGAELSIASDYCMLRMVHSVPLHLNYFSRFVQGLQGPSMKFFYENLTRIQTGEWHAVSEPETMKAYLAKRYPSANERVAFTVLSCILAYDTLVVSHNQGETSSCLQFVDPHFLGMPAERYVQLYHQEKTTCWDSIGADGWEKIDGEYPDGKGRWKNTRRILKRLAMKDFQKYHHIGTQSNLA